MSDTPSTPTPGAIPTASFGANAGVISSSAAPAAGPEAIAQAEALQRQALDTKLPRSQQMALVQQALAIRQGRVQATSTPAIPTPSQAAPAPTPTPIPASVTEEARLAETWGVTPDELAAADQALSSRVGDGVTAAGVARLAHVGSEFVDGLTGYVDALPEAEVGPWLQGQRESVERLYSTPEAHAEAVADVKAAIAKAFPQGLPDDLAEDLALAFDHSPRVHQQICLMAQQVLRAAGKF